MLHIGGENIDCVNNFNFLGIVLNQHLNWHSHTTKIANEICRGVTIRYPHDTIRIAILESRYAIPGENRKMNQLITIGSLYCILCVCSFDLSRQHLAFALLLLFNSMNTLYIIV